jgi:hypothetical protein
MKELEEEMRQDWQGALGSCQRSLEADICIKLYEGFYKKSHPKSFIFMGFYIINHPFWALPLMEPPIWVCPISGQIQCATGINLYTMIRIPNIRWWMTRPHIPCLDHGTAVRSTG